MKMERSSEEKNIFQQTAPQICSAQNLKSQIQKFKQYTQNFSSKISNSLKDQRKAIVRKRISLQNQLKALNSQFHQQRTRIRQLEEFFKSNCEDILKADIDKWSINSKFFQQLCVQYQKQLNLHKELNKSRFEEIQNLKTVWKEIKREQIKEQIQGNFQSQVEREKQKKIQYKQKSSLSKSKRLKTYSNSTISVRKLKTEISEGEESLHAKVRLQKPLRIQFETQQKGEYSYINAKQQTQQDNYSRNKRIKTQASLPSLKKHQVAVFYGIDEQTPTSNRTKIFDYSITNRDQQQHYMLPTGSQKKSQQAKQKSQTFTKIIDILTFYRNQIISPQNNKNSSKTNLKQSDKAKTKEVQIGWFEKVIFNQINFDKIMGYLRRVDTEEGQNIEEKKREKQRRVKQLVAKNLFRLKTEEANLPCKRFKISNINNPKNLNNPTNQNKSKKLLKNSSTLTTIPFFSKPNNLRYQNQPN